MSKNTLHIKDLHAEVDDQKILNGLSLSVSSGEIHVVMGPNGSGKSTLCNTIFNNPKYRITKGEISFNKRSLRSLSTDQIANLGLFLSFQNPIELPGVSFERMLRTAINNQSTASVDPLKFNKELKETAHKLHIREEHLSRAVNEGFSGGEKKKAEILQMAALKPKIAILDEIDSGLDIDALKTVAENIKLIHKEQHTGILLITHYKRILKYLTPNFVHVISEGKIIKSGTETLAHQLEEEGFNKIIKDNG